MEGVWLLVLTLMTSHGVAVAQVGPFGSYSACQSAASVWVTQNKSLASDARAACVRRYEHTGFGKDPTVR